MDCWEGGGGIAVGICASGQLALADFASGFVERHELLLE